MQALLDFLTHLPKDHYLIPGLFVIVILAVIWDRIEKSEKYLRFIIVLFPKSARAHYNLGSVLVKKPDQQDHAEKEFLLTIALDPQFRDAYYALADVLFKKVDWKREIENLCVQMLKYFPNDSRAHAILGFSYEKQDLFQEAEQSYRKSIEFAPMFVAVYANLMDVLVMQKRFAEVEEILHHLENEKLSPLNSAKAYLLKAYGLHNAEKYSEAAIAYEKVIQKDPGNASAYLNLGILFHEKLNRFNDAEQAYRHAIQIDPRQPLNHFQLGWLLYDRLHRYEEAEAMFIKTLELDPNDGDALYNLACIKSIQQDTELAFKYLQDTILKGFDKEWVWNDKDWEWLRNDPRFEEIVGPCPEKELTSSVEDSILK